MVSASLSWLVTQLRPFFDLIVPAFVVGFFLVALVAIALSDDRTVRNSYLAGFFALLVVVNLFAPVTPAPVIKWHKFSEVRGTEKTEYVFRVVDADGAELTYDDEATLNTGSVAPSYVRLKMQNEFTPAQNAETAQWLLDRAAVHRERVTNPSPTRFLYFPRHAMADTWTRETVADYSEFTGLRLYRVDMTFAEDGTEVTSYTETLVYEYYEDRGTTVEIASVDDAVDPVETAAVRSPAIVPGGAFS
ncbi:hypothetical protein SAMN04487948_101206 [Halogranum amylolyticum]|uniref:Uncharacterized protein n=1 Tax=Halogranum amylolyticum TaxID=660520 RepID=A0A1H8MZR7_9EURY|nr:hypothetical protein [Halogranum amylolyticum]SEO22743.1 hypothetical protein SAMN04487948_101206 [Halogranum amylolyticum]